MVEDVDLSGFVNDIKETIQHLEKEEEIEEEIVQEQRDAEQKLADTLDKLKQEEGVFRALIYFRKVDTNAPAAEQHQQVEKIISNINQIGSARQLQQEFDKVENILQEIEQALSELRDADKKTQQDVQDEEETVKDFREIIELVNEIRDGETKYREWARGRE
ncbi:MAG: hypothetical protein ABEJ75_04300 [Candidatus Nanohaloarchaea archaeon]